MDTDPGAPQPEVSTLAMLHMAFEEGRALLQVEAKLTRDELGRDLRALKTTAVLLVLSLQLATLAISMLLFAAVLGLSAAPPVTAVCISITLGVVAAVCGVIGAKQRPALLRETKQRLSRDRELIKNLEVPS